VDEQSRSDIALLYRRAGFGLRPAELDRAAAGGYQAAVDSLIAGLGSAPDPTGDLVRPPSFESYPPPQTASGPAAEARQQAEKHELAALQRWWLDRMIATSTPLREKLTLFWHGHFATGAAKVRDPKLMYLQNQLFRTAGSGGFEALTQAVAKDGAMMVWLDTGTDKKAHPNENFAREMMELFTLGLGNFTQSDVTAAARAFTGWVYNRVDYHYEFRPRQHDYGAKTYLGLTGDWSGEDVVRIAVTRPESARFVLARLWSHFAYVVEPSDEVVTDLLSAYGSGLDIGAVLRAVFLHPAFLSPQAQAGLVKQPIEYLVGAARALGLGADLEPEDRPSGARAGPVEASSRSLPVLAGALGQSPFNPPNVGGWGQNAYWLDTATALLRLEIALLLVRRADLSSLEALRPGARVAAVADLLGLNGWGRTTQTALVEVAADAGRLTALALIAPEYVLA
jgi:uncharacterized protein (DUF1800 family)